MPKVQIVCGKDETKKIVVNGKVVAEGKNGDVIELQGANYKIAISKPYVKPVVVKEEKKDAEKEIKKNSKKEG